MLVKLGDFLPKSYITVERRLLCNKLKTYPPTSIPHCIILFPRNILVKNGCCVKPLLNKEDSPIHSIYSCENNLRSYFKLLFSNVEKSAFNRLTRFKTCFTSKVLFLLIVRLVGLLILQILQLALTKHNSQLYFVIFRPIYT